MAFYDMKCLKCECIYEVSSTISGKEENVKKAKCPECKSKRKEELIGVPGYKFNQVIGTDRYMSDGTGHDYRHNWNMDRKGGVRDQRKYAEANSHVGPKPYNDIDDISSGKYFGEVK